MSKKNSVTYVKPEEPSFLRKLKEQAGFKEGPTIDTKREVLSPPEDNVEDQEDEKPTVVVLEPGDLTAEEAEAAQKEIDQTAAEAPADLNSRIIFRAPSKNSENPTASKRRIDSKSNRSKKSKTQKSLLSFDEEDDN